MSDPTFTLVGTNAFGLGGGHAYGSPALVDIDGDGDLDVAIGAADGTITVYRNIGTTVSPSFSLIGTNPFGLASVGGYAAPEFQDIDGDGDLDAVVGNQDGATVIYRNVGSSTAPSFTLEGTNAFGFTGVGGFASPTMADIDGDGDLDAIVGNASGNVPYHRNDGTSSSPTISRVIGGQMGLANVGSYAAPAWVDIDQDGDIDALTGNSDGRILLYRNGGTSTTPTFTLAGTDPFGLAAPDSYATPAFGDLDGDGDLDALIGYSSGGTVLLRNGTTVLSAPTGLALAAASNGGSTADTLTNDATPTITGTAAAATPVVLYDGATALGTATADGSGLWTITAASLGNGTHALTAASVSWGETSSASSALSVTIDTAVPTLTSAVLGGTRLILTYSEALDGAAAPTSAFTVMVGGAPRTVTAVATSGRTVTLTLDAGATPYQSATVSYTPPGSGALTGDLAGNAAAALSGQAVTEHSDPYFALAATNPFGLTSQFFARSDFADIDGDGDLDAMFSAGDGKTYFYRNVGTTAAPSFSLTATDPFGLADIGNYATANFHDIDGDGDLDVFLADASVGTAVFFRNVGTTAAPSFTLFGSDPFGLINPDKITAVSFLDTDGDGDLDALVGTQPGDIVLYRNDGTTTAPTFTLVATNPFGLANVDGTGSNPGYATPSTVDIDGDGDLDLVVGTGDGDTVVFRNVGVSGAPSFTLVGSNPFGLARPPAGAYTRPVLVDIDGDGLLDAMIGDLGGNTYFYQGVTAPPVGLGLATASNSGSTGDTLTNVTAPAITGTAVPGSAVVLYDGATALGTATADTNGLWTVTAASLGSGAHSLTARSVAGNGTSSASTALVVTIDTTAAAPTGLALDTGADTGASSSDRITRIETPAVTGTVAEAGTVVLYDGATAIGTVAAAGAGAWTITPGTLLDGTHTLVARVTDAAGNTSGTSSGLVVTVDTTAPSAPTVTGFTDDTGTTGDGRTADTTPTVSGTAEAGAVVVVSVGGTAAGTVTASGGGAWSFTTATLTEGAHSVTAVAVDTAGNTSSASSALVVTVDTTAPSAPTLSGFSDDTGTTGDGRTADTTPTVTGTAEAGATVVLYDGATALGTATAASGSGAWTITAPSLGDGVHSLTAVAVDVAANTSTASTALAVTIDTTAAAPTGLALDAASDTGASASDRLTTDTTPTITGTVAEAGTVVLYDGATAVGTVAAAGAGAWTITPASLAAGLHTLTARVTDVAANTSGVADALTVTIDTTAPTLAGSTPAAGATAVAVTDDLVLTFAEVVVAGTTAAKVSLYRSDLPGTPVETFDLAAGTGSAGGTAVVSGSTVTLNPFAALSYSTLYHVQATATAVTDQAGNAFAGIADTTTLTFTTGAAPPPPPDAGGGTTTVTTPVVGSQVTVVSTSNTTSTVDGVTVQEQRLTTASGAVVEIIEVPTVTADRTDANATTTGADIPLARDTTTGQTVLQASVPTGLGLRVEGVTTAQTPAAATTGLIQAIRSRTADQPSAQTEMADVGASFLAGLPADAQLTVRTIVPTAAAGASPTTPLTITGTTTTGATAREALVIDASALPSGTVIQLDNVSFAAVVGAVRVTGGAGSQSVVGDSSAQYIVLGADDDTLRGGDGNDFVGSEGGADLLYGDGGDDTVTGGEGNDLLFGNRQNDALYGNQGADTLFGGQDTDTLFGGQDGDTGYGQLGTDVLYGQFGTDTLFGGQGTDTLFGGQGDDAVYGNRDADLLHGNLGNDTLVGGRGADTLTGGGGADRFRYDHADEGGDTIIDFTSGEDLIAVLSPNFGNLAVGVLSAQHFALGTPGDGDDWFVFDTTTGVLSFDADGNGAGVAVTIATLDTRTLRHSDITVLAG